MSHPTDCPECGRSWHPSMYESETFPGSACDLGECICAICEDGAEFCPRHNPRERAGRNMNKCECGSPLLEDELTGLCPRCYERERAHDEPHRAPRAPALETIDFINKHSGRFAQEALAATSCELLLKREAGRLEVFVQIGGGLVFISECDDADVICIGLPIPFDVKYVRVGP